MKGIILAGGSGTRLYPITKSISKQLLPVYDKPMIYYPLSTLMLAKIRDILIISTKEDLPKYKQLLGNGKQFGIKLTYKVQNKPNGLAQAFVIGEKFIGKDDVCLVLGDNIFYGNGFTDVLMKASNKKGRATVFGQYVNDPERYGVVEFNKDGKVVSLEEKPINPKSNYAVVGLYFYDNKVVDYAKKLKPSKRGEYEITDLNKVYLKNNKLDCEVFGRGFAWLDTGTISSLNDAANYVRSIEDISGIKICVPEEIAFYNGWITEKDIKKAIDNYSTTNYGKHLQNVLNSRYFVRDKE